jgi:phage baseplate assembly protein gpV
MFVVRYPDGTAVTYNTAGYLYRAETGWNLYTRNPDDGGTWVASIMHSAGATIEAVTACKVERPEDQAPLHQLLRAVVARLEDRENYVHYKVHPALRRLKKLLQSFDMRGNTWR